MNQQEEYIQEFKIFLQLEKAQSENTVESYLRDVTKLHLYLKPLENKQFENLELNDFQNFLADLVDLGASATSQARIISGVKAFYKYLEYESIIKENPTELLESPKLGRKLPDTLTYEEIQQIIDSVDLSHPQGTRNRAILETLYSCGLRVSELINLQISNLKLKNDFIKVTGKGDKERLIPIGESAKKHINIYQKNIRIHQAPQKGYDDILFLNRRGKGLTRVMVFYIIKEAVSNAEINKTVSPHTFRHSFATHLVEGGADLRAVQEMLGHVSITTTEIYTHLDQSYLKSELFKFHPMYSFND